MLRISTAKNETEVRLKPRVSFVDCEWISMVQQGRIANKSNTVCTE